MNGPVEPRGLVFKCWPELKRSHTPGSSVQVPPPFTGSVEQHERRVEGHVCTGMDRVPPPPPSYLDPLHHSITETINNADVIMSDLIDFNHGSSFF